MFQNVEQEDCIERPIFREKWFDLGALIQIGVGLKVHTSSTRLDHRIDNPDLLCATNLLEV